MANLALILLVFAFVFAVIAAAFVQTVRNFHMGWLAVAFFLLSLIVGGIGKFI